MTELSTIPIGTLLARYPCIREFFRSIGLPAVDNRRPLTSWLARLADEAVLDAGMDREQILAHIERLVAEVAALDTQEQVPIRSIAILGGCDKTGRQETARVDVACGQIACIVGPTGSGKSRLLADIECLAQCDTPTRRTILVNGEPAATEARFGLDQKPVAQISQNMNFVVDLSVREFVEMHAHCRMAADPEKLTTEVIACANELTGERFSPSTSVTQLSGGQARALMIADAALISAAPIVLIDEIENAGVDRKQALELLMRGKKIVFISTHDPLLALRGHLRIAIQDGGIAQVLATSDAERRNLASLEAMDAIVSKLRDQLRQGQRVEDPIRWPG